MRKIRNPRYAPEFLERKLSPSDITAMMPTAVVAPTTDPTTTDTLIVSTEPTTDPTLIDYPPPPPPPPTGPTVPA